MSAMTINASAVPSSAAVSVGRSAPRTVGYRLTRRGRAVVFVASLLAVFGALFVALDGASVASGERGTAPAVEVVRVGTGETLWQIADEAAGSGSTREMVDRIIELNSLDGGLVMAGQQLNVPLD